RVYSVIARDEVRSDVRLRRVQTGVGHACLDACAQVAVVLRLLGVRRDEAIEAVAEARSELRGLEIAAEGLRRPYRIVLDVVHARRLLDGVDLVGSEVDGEHAD